MNYAPYTRKREHFGAQPQVISNDGYCRAESDYVITNAGPDGTTTFCYACPKGTTYDLSRDGCIDSSNNKVPQLNLYPANMTPSSPMGHLEATNGRCQNDTDFYMTGVGPQEENVCIECPPNATFNTRENQCVDMNSNFVGKVNMYTSTTGNDIKTIQSTTTTDDEEQQETTSDNESEEETDGTSSDDNEEDSESKNSSSSSFWSFCVLS